VFRDAFTHSGKSLSVDDNYRCSKGLILARTKTRPSSAPTAAQLTLFHASGCAAPMAAHSAAACSITRRHASPAHAGRPRHHDRFLGPLLAPLRCCGSGVGPQGAPFWGASGPYLGCIRPLSGGSCPLSGGSDVTKIATTAHPLRCQRAGHRASGTPKSMRRASKRRLVSRSRGAPETLELRGTYRNGATEIEARNA
jgi:hypothetical protein